MQADQTKKLAYICSPLHGAAGADTRKAIRYSEYAANCGVIPIAPLIAWNGVFDDVIPEQRATALKLGLALLRRCDEVWAMGNEVTQRMQGEIAVAERLKIPVLYVLDEIVEQNLLIRQQNAPLGPEDALGDDGQNYSGRILVLKPESIKPEYRISDHSLWAISHGPGCRPGSATGTVHAHNLFDGDYIAFHRSDFYGPVKPESLLLWFQDHPIKNNLLITNMLETQAQTQEHGLDYPYLSAQCDDETPIQFTVGGNLAPLCDANYFHQKLKPVFIAWQEGKAKPQPIIEVQEGDIIIDGPMDNETEWEP